MMYPWSEVKRWKRDGNWYCGPDGARIYVGDDCRLGDGCTLGDDCTLGNYCTLGDDCTLGDGCTLGNGCTLGDDCRLGDDCTLGNYCTLGDDQTTADIERQFAAALAAQVDAAGELHFWRWCKVRGGRYYSLCLSGVGRELEYVVGETISEPAAKISDAQCAAGIHVVRIGYRPEWLGLAETGHNLACLDVAARPEDVCYAGLPGCDTKLRLRSCRVCGVVDVDAVLGAKEAEDE